MALRKHTLQYAQAQQGNPLGPNPSYTTFAFLRKNMMSLSHYTYPLAMKPCVT